MDHVKRSEGKATPPPGKLILSVLFSDVRMEPQVIRDLEASFGPVQAASERISFGQTDYYTAEMGGDLHRRMVAFRDPIRPDRLVRAKLMAQMLEDRLRDSRGHRRVNLDPGILGLNNFVLATHKGYTHRIYLGQGVYADLTLVYSGGRYRPLEWTYPDYASPPLLWFLDQLRAVHLWERRRRGRGET